MIIIRSSNGDVFNKVENPAVVVDAVKDKNGIVNKYIMMKIGEKENMLDYQNIVIDKYKKNGFEDYINIRVIELPKKQKLIDKVFQTTGYLTKILKDIDFNKKETKLNEEDFDNV